MSLVLPDLTPRDFHSLWYISSRNPNRIPPHLDPTLAQHGDGAHHPAANPNGLPNGPLQSARSRTQQAAVIERSALGRLRADEAYLDRHRANVVNLGHTWLKPPGLSKTLHQMREERREAEEHAEALRREQLAQDLAEAAEGDANVAGEGGVNPMDALDMDVDPQDPQNALTTAEEEVEVDLDAEIPDADDSGFGYDGASSDEEDNEEEGDSDEGGSGHALDESRQQRQAQRLEVASMRATEDRMREAMARTQVAGGDVYGDEELDEDGQGQILEEDDLVHDQLGVEEGMDMDMDANLDDDIPDAESGGYEHTDSDASVSDDDDRETSSFAVARSSAQAARVRASLAYTDRSRNSLDINSLLSGSGSSVMGSSPQMRRRA